jgi:cytochrome c oxidase subunit 2
VAVILALMACTPSHNQSTFDPVGPVAEKQLDLFMIIFLAAVVVFIVVGGALIYTVIRFRRKEGQTAIPTQTHGNTPLEIGWTIAPAIVLLVVAVPTIIYIFDIAKEPPPGALEVNVTGHQWWWEFEYPEQNVVTANELHIPVDVPVMLNLRSDDVIHSFWVPKLAGKRDVIPTHVNPLTFTASGSDIDTLPAILFGQCAEFCGVAHAHMRFRVVVESQEDFDGWVANYHEIASRPAPTGETEEAKGFTAFASRGCLLCHKTDGPASAEIRQSLKDAFERGELRFPAPNLTNFGTRTTMAAGMMDLNRENLIKWLHDPDDVKPGNRMAELANVYIDPDARLSDEEISALAAYLLSLK